MAVAATRFALPKRGEAWGKSSRMDLGDKIEKFQRLHIGIDLPENRRKLKEWYEKDPDDFFFVFRNHRVASRPHWRLDLLEIAKELGTDQQTHFLLHCALNFEEKDFDILVATYKNAGNSTEELVKGIVNQKERALSPEIKTHVLQNTVNPSSPYYNPLVCLELLRTNPADLAVDKDKLRRDAIECLLKTDPPLNDRALAREAVSHPDFLRIMLQVHPRNEGLEVGTDLAKIAACMSAPDAANFMLKCASRTADPSDPLFLTLEQFDQLAQTYSAETKNEDNLRMFRKDILEDRGEWRANKALKEHLFNQMLKRDSPFYNPGAAVAWAHRFQQDEAHIERAEAEVSNQKVFQRERARGYFAAASNWNEDMQVEYMDRFDELLHDVTWSQSSCELQKGALQVLLKLNLDLLEREQSEAFFHKIYKMWEMQRTADPLRWDVETFDFAAEILLRQGANANAPLASKIKNTIQDYLTTEVSGHPHSQLKLDFTRRLLMSGKRLSLKDWRCLNEWSASSDPDTQAGLASLYMENNLVRACLDRVQSLSGETETAKDCLLSILRFLTHRDRGANAMAAKIEIELYLQEINDVFFAASLARAGLQTGQDALRVLINIVKNAIGENALSALASQSLNPSFISIFVLVCDPDYLVPILANITPYLNQEVVVPYLLNCAGARGQPKGYHLSMEIFEKVVEECLKQGFLSSNEALLWRILTPVSGDLVPSDLQQQVVAKMLKPGSPFYNPGVCLAWAQRKGDSSLVEQAKAEQRREAAAAEAARKAEAEKAAAALAHESALGEAFYREQVAKFGSPAALYDAIGNCRASIAASKTCFSVLVAHIIEDAGQATNPILQKAALHALSVYSQRMIDVLGGRMEEEGFKAALLKAYQSLDSEIHAYVDEIWRTHGLRPSDEVLRSIEEARARAQQSSASARREEEATLWLETLVTQRRRIEALKPEERAAAQEKIDKENESFFTGPSGAIGDKDL